MNYSFEDPQLVIDISGGGDFGSLRIGSLTIDWCNAGDGDEGSFDFGIKNEWYFHMGYYKSSDPFTGQYDNDYQFVDWEFVNLVPTKKSISITGLWFKLIDKIKLVSWIVTKKAVYSKK